MLITPELTVQKAENVPARCKGEEHKRLGQPPTFRLRTPAQTRTYPYPTPQHLRNHHCSTVSCVQSALADRPSEPERQVRQVRKQVLQGRLRVGLLEAGWERVGRFVVWYGVVGELRRGMGQMERVSRRRR